MIGLLFESNRHIEEIGSTAMQAAKRLTGVKPEVNLRECVTYVMAVGLGAILPVSTFGLYGVAHWYGHRGGS